MADNEKPPEPGKPDAAEKPAETGKPVKAPKAPKPAKKDDVHLPVLVEFTVLVAIFIIVLVFFTVAGVSILTGATLLDFVVRTSITLLVIGVPVVFLAQQVTSGLTVSDVLSEEKPDQAAEPAPDTQVEGTANLNSLNMAEPTAIPSEVPVPSEVK